MLLLRSRGVYKNIVDVYRVKDIKIIAERLVNILLEYTKRIYKSKEGNYLFKESIPYTERYYLFIALSDTYLIKSDNYIKFYILFRLSNVP